MLRNLEWFFSQLIYVWFLTLYFKTWNLHQYCCTISLKVTFRQFQVLSKICCDFHSFLKSFYKLGPLLFHWLHCSRAVWCCSKGHDLTVHCKLYIQVQAVLGFFESLLLVFIHLESFYKIHSIFFTCCYGETMWQCGEGAWPFCPLPESPGHSVQVPVKTGPVQGLYFRIFHSYFFCCKSQNDHHFCGYFISQVQTLLADSTSNGFENHWKDS